MPQNQSDPTSAPAGPRTPTLPSRQISLWALASLFCGVGFGCPPLALLAPLLGIAGVSQVHHRPDQYKGRNLAIAGIILGLVGIAVWAVGLRWADRNVRTPILDGPEPALQQAFAGDYAGFRSFFTGPAANASDAEIAAFVQELARRYGGFQGMTLGTVQTRDVREDDIQPADIVRPYLIRCSEGAVEADARFVAFQPGGFLDFVGKWRWIIIRDPSLGDFSFPADAVAEYERQPADAPPADDSALPAQPSGRIPGNGSTNAPGAAPTEADETLTDD